MSWKSYFGNLEWIASIIKKLNDIWSKKYNLYPKDQNKIESDTCNRTERKEKW